MISIKKGTQVCLCYFQFIIFMNDKRKIITSFETGYSVNICCYTIKIEYIVEAHIALDDLKIWYQSFHQVVIIYLPIPKEYKCLGLVPNSATSFVVNRFPSCVLISLFALS